VIHPTGLRIRVGQTKLSTYSNFMYLTTATAHSLGEPGAGIVWWMQEEMGIVIGFLAEHLSN